MTDPESLIEAHRIVDAAQNAAAFAMIDRLPLNALLELQATLEAMDLKYKLLGVDVPPWNVEFKVRVKSRIAMLRGGMGQEREGEDE